MGEKVTSHLVKKKGERCEIQIHFHFLIMPCIHSYVVPGASEDMALYTKYDFIPGDKVIFYDDFSSEEMGEFPSRWRLDEGVFEVAKQGGKNWILSADGG